MQNNVLRIFFLVTPLGFEELAKKELSEKIILLKLKGIETTIKEIEMLEGGIEFQGSLESALVLQRFIKIPSRILMRIGKFKATEFHQIAKGMKKIDMSLMRQRVPSEIEVSCQKSKLGQEKRVKATIEDFFKSNSYQTGTQTPTLYVRAKYDEFQLSLDLSGEHLHFRGYRKQQGVAPLRENFAAALFSLLVNDMSYSKVNQCLLFDPFLGSGTLVIESLIWNQKVHLRSFIGEQLVPKSVVTPDVLFPLGLEGAGSEIDKETFNKANKNRENLPIELQQKINFLFSDQRNVRLDSAKNILIISNPPYGERLNQAPEKTLKSIVESVQNINPIRAGYLVPMNWKLNQIEGYKLNEDFKFNNNGLKVKFVIYTRLESQI